LTVAEVYTAASQVVAARELGNAVLRGKALSDAAAVTGEVVPGIRTLDIPGSAIPGSAIPASATAIRMQAIMVTDPVGAMIHITGIVPADTILTDTGTGLTCASASVAIKL